VLDREFSYLELMLNLMEEHINWVIRLNLRAHPPKFYDGEGKEVALTISPGETAVLNKIWYMGKVLVNVIGVWKTGLAEPMWIMTNLEAKRGLQIYYARMKIEQTYRDCKSLLGLTKLMNKQQVYMEKMVALLLLTFTIGLLVGEELRDLLYGEPITDDELVEDEERIPGSPSLKKGKNGNAILVCSCCLNRSGRSPTNRKPLSCKPPWPPFAAWFTRMSVLLSEPQADINKGSTEPIKLGEYYQKLGFAKINNSAYMVLGNAKNNRLFLG